jgi:methylene-tetrahydromethanopterin dehydrogenase
VGGKFRVRVRCCSSFLRIVSPSDRILEIDLVSDLEAVEIMKLRDICFFLDSDEYASPFDICMAYDAGFDVVVPYGRVTVAVAKQLAQDTIFSRGSTGMRHTCFLVGGGDLAESKRISDAITAAMFPPFEAKLIVDPRGAYTTAAALVAKVECSLRKLKIRFSVKAKVIILAGTGPVGKATAVLCAKLGYDTYVTSRDSNRVRSAVQEIAEEYRLHIGGLKVSNWDEIRAAMGDALVVICAGPPRVTIVSGDILDRLEGTKLILDANAISPLGVEGLNPDGDLLEMRPGIYGIGANAIGKLKYSVEKAMLKDARLAGKGTYDLDYAFRKAGRLLERRPRHK